MNENISISTLTDQDTLSKTIFNDIYQKFSDIVFNSETMSKEKYEKKEKLIEADATMSTQQKLDAMDQNFKCRKQEQRQNILNLIIPIGLLLIYKTLEQNQTR